LEVPVLHRLVFLIVLLAVPAVCQRATLQSRINASVEQHQQQISQTPPAAGPDERTIRREEFHRDVTELSTLSASVQSDLQKLQRGVLVKDLHENLKKLEKLSKKVRQELE
jgi:hypothetical protein